MASCEKCWADAAGNPELYRELFRTRNCTPEEQAGVDATECPVCHRRAVHQHCHICMACGEEVLNGSVCLAIAQSRAIIRHHKVEQLAALEHEQWAEWAKSLIANEALSMERCERWQRLIETPYKDLTEEEKDQDREWAERAMSIAEGY